MDFSLVERVKSAAYFEQVERIYLASFPISQIRPTKMITHMLEFDPNYHLLLVRQRDTIVGFSLLYAFNELSAAFLDFMAIDKAYRDRGIGSNLLKYTLNASRRFVTNSIGVIFEVERESTIEHVKSGFRYRRVKFYRRHGARAFDNVQYMLPDLHGGKHQDMYLMIIPNRKLVYLKKSIVLRIIKSIYLTMYHYHDDSDLLDLTIEDLPPTIRLI